MNFRQIAMGVLSCLLIVATTAESMRHTGGLLAQEAATEQADDATADPPADETEQPETSVLEPALDREIKVDSTVPDARIANRIQRILEESDFYTNPEVTVREGLVTLRGGTESAEFRDRAGDWARATEGVVAVFNKIAVEENNTITAAGGRVSDSARAIWNDILRHSPLIVAGLLVLSLTGLAVRFCQWLFNRTPGSKRLRLSLHDLIEQLIAVGVWILGILIAATVIFPEMTPTKLLTVLGLSSVAIGFAFKDIFENFLAGILILWKFPFDRGDFIECGDVAGKVQQITIRNTLIRQVDGQLVVAPNGLLFKNPVKVLTNWHSRRITVICGVAYGEDVDKSRAVIQEAVKACGTVEHRKPIEIFAREFGESSINFEVTWWAAPTPLEERQSRDEVVSAVKRALDIAGIEIPFPYRTLTFKEPLRVASREALKIDERRSKIGEPERQS